MGKQSAGMGKGTVAALALGGLALVGLFGYGIYQDSVKSQEEQGQRAADQKDKPANCIPSPVKVNIEGMERVPCKSQSHVSLGTKLTYDSDPPLSGDHHDNWVSAGFHTRTQNPGMLVHNLEHGNIVIYYNKAKVSDDALKALEQLANQYKGVFDGVVVVPREDDKHAVILTAWEHAVRLEQYDKARIDQFVDAFRGRGPERPVRPIQ